MGKIYDRVNKFFKIIPGGIFGILSGLIGIICDIIAISLYPGYNLLYDMVSTLGVGPGADFFNYGLIFSGVFAAIFYVYLYLTFIKEEPNEKINKSTFIIAVISSLLMSSIGVFPAIQDKKLIVFLHYITALLTWVTGIIYCTMLGYLIIKSSIYSHYLAIIACIPAFMMTILLIFIMSPLTQDLVPLTEWLMVFSVIGFVFIISSYTLYKKI